MVSEAGTDRAANVLAQWFGLVLTLSFPVPEKLTPARAIEDQGRRETARHERRGKLGGGGIGLVSESREEEAALLGLAPLARVAR